jgi:hypothetical protein
MKTTSTHTSNLAAFRHLEVNSDGFVRMHQSGRYAAADDDRLACWARTGSLPVRNAAQDEIYRRKVYGRLTSRIEKGE